jgi:hypothetical protein
MTGLAVIVLAVGAIAAACGGGGASFDDPRLQEFDDAFTNPGQDHLPVGTVYPNYPTFPPYAGPHWQVPSRCGIYELPQPIEAMVHSMEHGVVIFYFQPDLFRADEVAEMRVVASGLLRDGRRLIMTPNRQIDSAVVMTSWSRILRLGSFEPETVEDFTAAFEDKAPEGFSVGQACAGELHVR